jgi:hypothetical protein
MLATVLAAARREVFIVHVRDSAAASVVRARYRSSSSSTNSATLGTSCRALAQAIFLGQLQRVHCSRVCSRSLGEICWNCCCCWCCSSDGGGGGGGAGVPY